MIGKSKCCNLKSDLREAVIILMHRGKQEGESHRIDLIFILEPLTNCILNFHEPAPSIWPRLESLIPRWSPPFPFPLIKFLLNCSKERIRQRISRFFENFEIYNPSKKIFDFSCFRDPQLFYFKLLHFSRKFWNTIINFRISTKTLINSKYTKENLWTRY